MGRQFLPRDIKMSRRVLWESKDAANVAIPSSSYRARKPPKAKAGNMEKATKKYKIPHPGLGPEKAKEIPQKIQNGPRMTSFVFFRYFFLIFRPNPGWGLFFSRFRPWPWGGLSCSVRARRNCNANWNYMNLQEASVKWCGLWQKVIDITWRLESENKHFGHRVMWCRPAKSADWSRKRFFHYSRCHQCWLPKENCRPILRIIFSHPTPKSADLLSEPGSERKVLTKETWFSLLRFESLVIAVGAIFAPTRFSLARIFIRDLVADRKSWVRNSGVGVGVKIGSSNLFHFLPGLLFWTPVCKAGKGDHIHDYHLRL